MTSDDSIQYVSIAPDIEGMKSWLALVAKDTDERALWGVRVAQALGILDWYADRLADEKRWEA